MSRARWGVNVVDIAQIELNAAKKERAEIAHAIRLLASMGRIQAKREGKNPETCKILEDLADLIETRKL